MELAGYSGRWRVGTRTDSFPHCGLIGVAKARQFNPPGDHQLLDQLNREGAADRVRIHERVHVMVDNLTTSYYLSLNAATKVTIEKSTSDPANIGRAQERVDTMNAWLRVLDPRPEAVVFRHAVNEATVGLFLLASGLYRPAFLSLRLFLELSLATIYFSANRVELAEWLNGAADVKWAVLSNEETGVLSLRYADAFFPQLRDSVRMYNTIASKIYRELSEFVHGNHHTWGVLSDQIAFNSSVQDRWLEYFDSASAVVLYASTLRFIKELDKGQLKVISPAIQDCLGHLESVREVLS